MRRLQQLVLMLLMAMMGSQTPLRAEQVMLIYAVDPGGASSVSLTLRGGERQLPIPNGPGDRAQASVELPTVAASSDGALTVLWPEERSVSADLTLTLAMAMSGMTIEAYFFDRSLADAPTPEKVNQACLGPAPRSTRAAFNMLYTCREMALKLDAEPHGHWDIPHRSAVQGWLVANKFLLENFGWDVDAGGVPIGLSPYGADEELEKNLRVMVDDERPSSAWEPLRIADARQFLALIDDRALRLAGDVPRLIALRQYEVAAHINDAAIEVLNARAGRGDNRRLTVQMLEAQGCFIKTKMNDGIPVPECLP